MASVTVKVKPVDTAWETLGADTCKGITPEGVQLTYDVAGPKTATMELRRDPLAVLPDIGTLADLEIDVDGIAAAWDGYVSESPKRGGSERMVAVQGAGWQGELDDDIVEKTWVHTDMGAWKDYRSFPYADLGFSKVSGQVQSEAGVIVLGFANGAQVDNGQMAGVMLDLGPTALAKRIVVFWANAGCTAGNYAFFARATDAPSQLATVGSYEDAWNVDPASASSPQSATLTTARRYVCLFLYRAGASAAETADRQVRISDVQVFTDAAYESGGASTLKASTVVTDVLDAGTLALSTDRSQITATSFAIPSMTCDSSGSTPREMVSRVNAFHDWIFKLAPGRVPVFKAKPSAPELEIGAWTPINSDEDASCNSADEIYNRVIVRGTAPDGSPVRVERTASQLAGVLASLAGPQPSNPSFDTNTTGWTASNSTITRDTGTYDSSPASGRWDATGASDALPANATLTCALSGTFLSGTTYTFVVAYKGPYRVGGTVGSSTARVPFYGWGYGTGSWAPLTFSWTPAATTGSASIVFDPPVTLYHDASPAPGYCNIDSVKVTTAASTVLDRRGRRRTKVLEVTSWPLPADGIAATQLADTYLAGHRLTPFKGRCVVQGNRAVRNILTGDYVHLAQLGLRTGELIRFSDRQDPDTGAWARDGRLVAVTYTPQSDTAELTIDNTRTSFEALLARIGVLAA